jgi:predicted GIY-YIG superfamily endonuclease
MNIEDTVTYVLLLENDNWYVGKSIHLYKRLSDHFNGHGSAWTKTHHPVSVKAIYLGDKEKECYFFAANKYGADKVRGYAYSQVKR